MRIQKSIDVEDFGRRGLFGADSSFMRLIVVFREWGLGAVWVVDVMCGGGSRKAEGGG
ncbi:MAG: hypothetical protein JJU02_07035 [Cryomorphaceae bacterium]|nr:hypothetical protein [Cryomorphaceae bacterium]